MHTSFVVLALAALHCARASKLPIQSLDNSLSNEISISEPVPSNDRKYFVEISEAPSPTRHVAGESTFLTCRASGHPAPRISWLKNDMAILEDELETNEIVQSSASSLANVVSTLLILTVSPNKEDVYTCVAESSLKTAAASATVYNDIDSIPQIFSSISSLNRHLLSVPRKPHITQHATTLLGDVGTTLVLPCKVSGNPNPQVFWRKGNELFTGDDRAKILDSGDLVFTDTRWSDMGVYTCLAKNAFGKDVAKTFFYPIVSEKSKYSRRHN